MRSTPSLRSFLSFAFEYTSSASSFFYASLPLAIDGVVHVLGSVPARGVVCLKLLNTSDRPRRESLVMGAVPAQPFCSVVCLKLLNTSDRPRREPLVMGAEPSQSFC